MFSPNKQVAVGTRAGYTSRPTVVAFVSVSGVGGESLLMVLPPKADLQGWILPQGEIYIQETPYKAALRVLLKEYGLKSQLFQDSPGVALAEATIEARSADEFPKHLLVVGLKCSAWVAPRSAKQSKFFLADGPNAAWVHFAGCRPEKQALFVRALASAIRHKNGRG